ncbi:MAG TPA: OmpA family protein [Acetobacteraceae bacterium]|uniref:OmpA family protein n=1 Tax=Actinocrinis sp. TaxID=1920516 RepID=UPI002B7D94A9|nr:OmpA family protein [Actinocrinis sp.]HXR71261.1 OmpA family protein [Actinocrinis sp.]HXT81812.1 OmpA family protein [Acetobacteraceae bacterium]
MRNRIIAGLPAVLLLVLAPAAFGAQAATDCPPVGHLPSYTASEAPEIRAYDTAAFSVTKGDDTTQVQVAGARCHQGYMIADGKDPMSDLEIQENYRSQLKALGADILFTDDLDTVARLSPKDPATGAETWIAVASQQTEIDVTVVRKQPFKASLKPPSGADYRLLGHMPGYVASKPEKRNFDKLSFTVQDGDDSHDVEVQGARYSVNYMIADNTTPASNLDIQENYRAALRALGAQILFTDDGDTVARLDDNGKAVWMHVNSQQTEIAVETIEEKAFQASIAPPKADALKATLDAKGHVALYVNFDFDKATLKPDAAPVMTQVVALLKADPSLHLRVEGHTDNVGSHDYNVKLSGARADTVVKALVAEGIAADRLSAAGIGPDKPIADNKTTEGRAKNRRVELVKS